MQKNNAKTSNKSDDFSTIAIFLTLECVALLSFCLGGITTIFHYIGFVVAAFSIEFAYKNFEKKELGSLLLISVPVLIIGICCAFGNLYGGFSNTKAIASNIGVFLAIPSFFALGIVSRRTKSFKVETALLCVGAGAALLVLVSLFATWIQYGFFYTLLYKNTPNYYYNGALYDVTSEMSWLNGLKFSEVTLKYGGLFGVCLCAALPALLFISPKKQTKKFVIVAAIALVGLLSILTLVNVSALIFLLPIAVIAIVYKLLINNKKVMTAIKIVLLVLVGLLVLFLLAATLNALIPSLHSITSSNSFLDRIFNSNRLMKPFNEIISIAFKPYNIFGFKLHPVGDTEGLNYAAIYENTGNFALEITKEGGIFALISLLMIIVLMVLSMLKYLKKSKDSTAIKVTFLSLLLTFFLYSCINWDIYPFTHQNDYVSVARSFPFLIIIFIVGLSYYPILMKEEPIFESFRIQKEEQIIKKETKYIDEDYVFTSSEEATKDEK